MKLQDRVGKASCVFMSKPSFVSSNTAEKKVTITEAHFRIIIMGAT